MDGVLPETDTRRTGAQRITTKLGGAELKAPIIGAGAIESYDLTILYLTFGAS